MTRPWEGASKEADFLRSALTTESPLNSVGSFLDWFQARRQANRFLVEQIPFAELGEWYFSEDGWRLAHRSGKFFSVEGLRVKTNYGPIAQWDQPIILQPEIGILGIITKKFDGVSHFLMQAKMEPGNINTLQLSPTLQATKSNYTQVHQGKRPAYLEYFTDRGRAKVLIDQLQPEQGSRFWRKRNRNMIVETAEDPPLQEDFCWLTLGQIKQLLGRDNLVNMDARTVLACIPLVATGEESARGQEIELFGQRLGGFAKDVFLSMLQRRNGRHSLDEVLSWFTELKTRYFLSAERRPLNQLEDWVITDSEIKHKSGRYFSVIAVRVQAGSREVVRWAQPLLKHFGYGLVGFLTQKIGGCLHFLVRACVEPGNRDTVEMGPTLARSGVPEGVAQRPALPFLELFLDPPADWVRYSAIQSEEGGRFYHFQNRYLILELPEDYRLELPEDYLWLTLGQIMELTRHGYFNIEARNLLACLDLLAGQVQAGQ